MRVTYADGTPLTAEDTVAPVNLFPHSLFQSIGIKINGQPCSDHARLYPYRAFAHINYALTTECKQSNLMAEHFIRDSINTTTENADPNTAEHKLRAGLISESKICKIVFQPRIDTLSIKRYFPPTHRLTLEFIRTPSNFSLLSSVLNNYKIEILDLKLRVRQVLPVESVENNFRKSLQTKPFHLPVTRLVTRTRSLCSGVYDGTIVNAVSGPLPHHIMVFLLSNAQLNGSVKSNPFFLGRRGLLHASLLVNSTEYPAEKLVYRESTGDVLRSYTFFNQNIGAVGDQTIGLNPSEYLRNQFALAFDLTPDLSLNSSYQKQLEGSIDIKLIFENALTEPLTVLYIMTYDNVITVSSDKQLLLDYQV